MRGNSSKAANDDLMTSFTRDYYNSDLNRVVDPSEIGLIEDPIGHHRPDNYFSSPINSKYGLIDRRDSQLQSPFKNVKSPLPGHYNQPLPDHYGFDDDPHALMNHLRSAYDSDPSYTVGQMFGVSEAPYAMRARDAIALEHAIFRDDVLDIPVFRSNQNMPPMIASSQPMAQGIYEEPGYNSNGCRFSMIAAYNRAKDEEGGNRCSRGLKVLSVKVRDIVYQKRETSYKEVAEALINDGSFEASLTVGTVKNKLTQNKKKKAREEQNVKRRVYDALNVLIAAEVLRKYNKVVFFNEQDKGVGRNLKSEKNQLIKTVTRAELELAKTKQRLQSVLQRLIAIKALIHRNKTHDLRCNVRFPFMMVIPSSGNDTEINFEMHPSYKKLKMSSNKEMTLNGDLDTMILLKSHLNLTRSQLEELFGELFDKDKSMMLGILEDDYLKIIHNREQHSISKRAEEIQPVSSWDAMINAD